MFVLAVGGPRAYACSCMAASPEEALRRPGVVFTGTATAVESLPASEAGDAVETSFTVTQSWKGNVPEKVAVQTLTSSAACGLTFDVGKTYTVAAEPTPDGQAYRTNLCTMLPFEAGGGLERDPAFALRAYKAQRAAIARAATEAPQDADAWLAKAEFSRQYGDHADAIEAYQRFLAIDPENVKALVHLGDVYSQAGQHDLALATIDRALAIAPGEAWATQWREEILRRREERVDVP
jgi:hypothetical protein